MEARRFLMSQTCMTTTGDDAVRTTDDEAHQIRSVSCPNCRANSVYAQSNPYRPFCSERCKNMDFGAWADESFRMADRDDSPDSTTHRNTLQ